MAEFLTFSEHLTSAPSDQSIRETYLGQAHIAGTGPAGTTCRECKWWRRIGRRREKSGGPVVQFVKAPAYCSKTHKTTPLELKKQHCTRPILNKAKRLIPHHAKSCRLFDPADAPPAAKRLEQ